MLKYFLIGIVQVLWVPKACLSMLATSQACMATSQACVVVHYFLYFTAYKAESEGGFSSMQDVKDVAKHVQDVAKHAKVGQGRCQTCQGHAKASQGRCKACRGRPRTLLCMPRTLQACLRYPQVLTRQNAYFKLKKKTEMVGGGCLFFYFSKKPKQNLI